MTASPGAVIALLQMGSPLVPMLWVRIEGHG